MNLTNFRFEIDADGVALVTWDMPGRSMNVINAEVVGELGQISDKIASDEAIKGAVFTSGKDGFAAGADLTMLETAGKEYARRAKAEGKQAAMRAFVDGTKQLSLVYRRSKPAANRLPPRSTASAWAAVSNWRWRAITASSPIQIRRASDCRRSRSGFSPARAARNVSRGSCQRRTLCKCCSRAIRFAPPRRRRWASSTRSRLPIRSSRSPRLGEGEPDRQGALGRSEIQASFRQGFFARGHDDLAPANAIYRRETYDNYPAAKAVLTCVFEGLQLPMDLALAVEASISPTSCCRRKPRR